jgi:hypothetical protein
MCNDCLSDLIRPRLQETMAPLISKACAEICFDIADYLPFRNMIACDGFVLDRPAKLELLLIGQDMRAAEGLLISLSLLANCSHTGASRLE